MTDIDTYCYNCGANSGKFLKPLNATFDTSAESPSGSSATAAEGQNGTQSNLSPDIYHTYNTSNQTRTGPEIENFKGNDISISPRSADLPDSGLRYQVERGISQFVRSRQTKVSNKNVEDDPSGDAVVTPISEGMVLARRGERDSYVRTPRAYEQDVSARKTLIEMQNPTHIAHENIGSQKHSNILESSGQFEESCEPFTAKHVEDIIYHDTLDPFSSPSQHSQSSETKLTVTSTSKRPSLTAEGVKLATANRGVSHLGETQKALSESKSKTGSDDVKRNRYETLRRHWSTWCRPSIRPRYQRIEWTCDCGEFLYGDFETSDQEGLSRLAARLRNPGQAEADETTHQQPIAPPPAPSPVSAQSDGQVRKKHTAATTVKTFKGSR
ncbi:hypothetical protein MMC26_005393 [Xylographa opegraphella]|nr:hypothetical protein [Xylographa opegraphella]